MTAESTPGTFAERLRAARRPGPSLEDLVSLPKFAQFLSVDLDMPLQEASLLIVQELGDCAQHLGLYQCHAGFYPQLLDDERVEIPLEDRVPQFPNWTHRSSDRDRALQDLSPALLCGHRLGSPAHQKTHDAGSLYLVKADALAYFHAPATASVIAPAPALHLAPPVPHDPGPQTNGDERRQPRDSSAGRVELVPKKTPGAPWSPAVRAELLRQFEALQQAFPREKVTELHGRLGDAWGFKPNSIKQFISEARKERQPAATRRYRA